MEKQEQMKQLIKPFENVLDDTLLQSISSGIQDFLSQETVQIKKSTKTIKVQELKETKSVIISNQEIERQIMEFMQNTSEAEAKEILEKLEGSNEEDVSNELIKLQQEKRKQAEEFTKPLEASLPPEILASIEESLKSMTSEQIEAMAQRPKKTKDEQFDEMLKIELEKRQSIANLLAPLQSSLPKELFETVESSVKEVAKSETKSESSTKSKTSVSKMVKSVAGKIIGKEKKKSAVKERSSSIVAGMKIIAEKLVESNLSHALVTDTSAAQKKEDEAESGLSKIAISADPTPQTMDKDRSEIKHEMTSESQTTSCIFQKSEEVTTKKTTKIHLIKESGFDIKSETVSDTNKQAKSIRKVSEKVDETSLESVQHSKTEISSSQSRILTDHSSIHSSRMPQIPFGEEDDLLSSTASSCNEGGLSNADMIDRGEKAMKDSEIDEEPFMKKPDNEEEGSLTMNEGDNAVCKRDDEATTKLGEMKIETPSGAFEAKNNEGSAIETNQRVIFDSCDRPEDLSVEDMTQIEQTDVEDDRMKSSDEIDVFVTKTEVDTRIEDVKDNLNQDELRNEEMHGMEVVMDRLQREEKIEISKLGDAEKFKEQKNIDLDKSQDELQELRASSDNERKANQAEKEFDAFDPQASEKESVIVNDDEESDQSQSKIDIPKGEQLIKLDCSDNQELQLQSQFVNVSAEQQDPLMESNQNEKQPELAGLSRPTGRESDIENEHPPQQTEADSILGPQQKDHVEEQQSLDASEVPSAPLENQNLPDAFKAAGDESHPDMNNAIRTLVDTNLEDQSSNVAKDIPGQVAVPSTTKHEGHDNVKDQIKADVSPLISHGQESCSIKEDIEDQGPCGDDVTLEEGALQQSIRNKDELPAGSMIDQDQITTNVNEGSQTAPGGGEDCQINANLGNVSKDITDQDVLQPSLTTKDELRSRPLEDHDHTKEQINICGEDESLAKSVQDNEHVKEESSTYVKGEFFEGSSSMEDHDHDRDQISTFIENESLAGSNTDTDHTMENLRSYVDDENEPILDDQGGYHRTSVILENQDTQGVVEIQDQNVVQHSLTDKHEILTGSNVDDDIVRDEISTIVNEEDQPISDGEEDCHTISSVLESQGICEEGDQLSHSNDDKILKNSNEHNQIEIQFKDHVQADNLNQLCTGLSQVRDQKKVEEDEGLSMVGDKAENLTGSNENMGHDQYKNESNSKVENGSQKEAKDEHQISNNEHEEFGRSSVDHDQSNDQISNSDKDHSITLAPQDIQKGSQINVNVEGIASCGDDENLIEDMVQTRVMNQDEILACLIESNDPIQDQGDDTKVEDQSSTTPEQVNDKTVVEDESLASSNEGPHQAEDQVCSDVKDESLTRSNVDFDSDKVKISGNIDERSLSQPTEDHDQMIEMSFDAKNKIHDGPGENQDQISQASHIENESLTELSDDQISSKLENEFDEVDGQSKSETYQQDEGQSCRKDQEEILSIEDKGRDKSDCQSSTNMEKLTEESLDQTIQLSEKRLDEGKNYSNESGDQIKVAHKRDDFIEDHTSIEQDRKIADAKVHSIFDGNVTKDLHSQQYSTSLPDSILSNDCQENRHSGRDMSSQSQIHDLAMHNLDSNLKAIAESAPIEEDSFSGEEKESKCQPEEETDQKDGDEKELKGNDAKDVVQENSINVKHPSELSIGQDLTQDEEKSQAYAQSLVLESTSDLEEPNNEGADSTFEMTYSHVMELDQIPNQGYEKEQIFTKNDVANEQDLEFAKTRENILDNYQEISNEGESRSAHGGDATPTDLHEEDTCTSDVEDHIDASISINDEDLDSQANKKELSDQLSLSETNEQSTIEVCCTETKQAACSEDDEAESELQSALSSETGKGLSSQHSQLLQETESKESSNGLKNDEIDISICVHEQDINVHNETSETFPDQVDFESHNESLISIRGPMETTIESKKESTQQECGLHCEFGRDKEQSVQVQMHEIDSFDGGVSLQAQSESTTSTERSPELEFQHDLPELSDPEDDQQRKGEGPNYQDEIEEIAAFDVQEHSREKIFETEIEDDFEHESETLDVYQTDSAHENKSESLKEFPIEMQRKQEESISIDDKDQYDFDQQDSAVYTPQSHNSNQIQCFQEQTDFQHVPSETPVSTQTSESEGSSSENDLSKQEIQTTEECPIPSEVKDQETSEDISKGLQLSTGHQFVLESRVETTIKHSLETETLDKESNTQMLELIRQDYAEEEIDEKHQGSSSQKSLIETSQHLEQIKEGNKLQSVSTITRAEESKHSNKVSIQSGGQDLDNQEEIQLLKNQVLEDQDVEGQDLKSQGLKRQDFESKDLQSKDLEEQDVESQDLEDQDFDCQDLKSHNQVLDTPNVQRKFLEDQALESLDIKSQDLKSQDLQRQDFESKDVEGQDIESLDQEEQDFESQDVEGQDFESLDQEEQDFESQDVEGQDLKSQDLKGQDFESQDLESPNQVLDTHDVESQGLVGQDFESQGLVGQDFESQDLEDQDFESQDLKSQDRKSQDFQSQHLVGQDYVSQDVKSPNQVLDTHDVERQGLVDQDLESEVLEDQDFEREDLKSQDLKSQDLQSQDRVGQDYESQDLKSPNQVLDTHDVESQGLEGQDLESQDQMCQDFESQDLKSQDLKNQDLQSQHQVGQGYESQDLKTLDLESQIAHELAKSVNESQSEDKTGNSGENVVEVDNLKQASENEESQPVIQAFTANQEAEISDEQSAHQPQIIAESMLEQQEIDASTQIHLQSYQSDIPSKQNQSFEIETEDESSQEIPKEIFLSQNVRAFGDANVSFENQKDESSVTQAASSHPLQIQSPAKLIKDDHQSQKVYEVEANESSSDTRYTLQENVSTFSMEKSEKIDNIMEAYTIRENEDGQFEEEKLMVHQSEAITEQEDNYVVTKEGDQLERKSCSPHEMSPKPTEDNDESPIGMQTKEETDVKHFQSTSTIPKIDGNLEEAPQDLFELGTASEPKDTKDQDAQYETKIEKPNSSDQYLSGFEQTIGRESAGSKVILIEEQNTSLGTTNQQTSFQSAPDIDQGKILCENMSRANDDLKAIDVSKEPGKYASSPRQEINLVTLDVDVNVDSKDTQNENLSQENVVKSDDESMKTSSIEETVKEVESSESETESGFFLTEIDEESRLLLTTQEEQGKPVLKSENKLSTRIEQQLQMIKKRHQVIMQKWTEYQERIFDQSERKSLQEMIEETEEMFQEISYSDEAAKAALDNLDSDILEMTKLLQWEDEMMHLMSEIAVSLQHCDAIITSYELDSNSIQDLNGVSLSLNQDYERISQLDFDRPILNERLAYLRNLHLDLVTRVQRLQSGCHHAIQVDTLKFEQDVGLQTDGCSGQESSTQTEMNSWLEAWIKDMDEQLDLIEIDCIKDHTTLISVLEDLQCIYEEIKSHLDPSTQISEDLKASLVSLKTKLEAKRALLVNSDQLYGLLEDSESSTLLQILSLIPTDSQLAQRLNHHLEDIKKEDEELPSTDFSTESSPNQHQERRCRRWMLRVMRASLPFQAGLLLLLGLASFAPIYREEIICSVQNTFRDSLEPMLQWTNGSPPI